MKARRAFVEVEYEGVNITDDVAKDLKDFSYTDVASGAADTISIGLKDENKKWLTNWAPEKGDIVKAKIKSINWKQEGDKGVLDCGTFIVDQPRYSGRPITLTLGAISMPNNSNFTTTKKSKTWDNATLEEIAATIAKNAGLELVFDSSNNPTINFIEQSETSDKSFLFDLCQNYGLAMKLYNKKIVIFDEAEYESKKSVTTIDETDMDGWEITPSLTDTGYDGCYIQYFDPITEELLDFTYIIPGSTGKKIYKINDIVYSLADAEKRAKAELRSLNKSETKITIKLPGGTDLVASNTVDITGLGKYDGKYYIDQIVHRLKPYKRTIDLHKVLEGY